MPFQDQMTDLSSGTKHESLAFFTYSLAVWVVKYQKVSCPKNVDLKNAIGKRRNKLNYPIFILLVYLKVLIFFSNCNTKNLELGNDDCRPSNNGLTIFYKHINILSCRHNSLGWSLFDKKYYEYGYLILFYQPGSSGVLDKKNHFHLNCSIRVALKRFSRLIIKVQSI